MNITNWWNSWLVGQIDVRMRIAEACRLIIFISYMPDTEHVTHLWYVCCVWWPFVTWPWPWPDLSIKHLLNHYLPLWIPDKSELREFMLLDQVRYAYNDSEVCFQAHMILFPLTLLVAGGGGCFYPPLGFFLNIFQTAWARILKFSDFS